MTSSTVNYVAPHNDVLASVASIGLKELRACLVPVSLVRRQVLVELGQPVDHVYFIERGVVSVLVKARSGEEGVQVAMIGREGMVGDLASGAARQLACVRIVVHIPGTALRVVTGDLHRAIESSPALYEACKRSIRSVMEQVMQTASCNTRLSLLERLARWLVMTHDRVDDGDVPVTHEALSVMLGIGRPSITVAAAALQQAGLIRVGRGHVTILDRAGLAKVAQGVPPLPSVASPQDDHCIMQHDGWASMAAAVASHEPHLAPVVHPLALGQNASPYNQYALNTVGVQ
jgi:CRP-like cAMP-binding protein